MTLEHEMSKCVQNGICYIRVAWSLEILVDELLVGHPQRNGESLREFVVNDVKLMYGSEECNIVRRGKEVGTAIR